MNFDEADKTDWFPGTIKPVRDGVYERLYTRHACAPNFATFGGAWYRGHPDVADAIAEVRLSEFTSFEFKWRGLKADPNTVVITPEVHAVAHNAPGLALDSGEFIPAEALNKSQDDEEEQLF